jgi:hypothetical protein
MENWLFNRPKERQREKIVHDVFVSGCFGATSCAKNRDSSELYACDVGGDSSKMAA